MHYQLMVLLRGGGAGGSVRKCRFGYLFFFNIFFFL